MDDIEIVERVQAGDTEAFSILVEKYHRHLLNFIYQLTGNEECVEDVGQEVFLSVYKSMRSFDLRRGVPFSAWLFITARHRCISEMRKKKYPTVAVEDVESILAHDRTPERAVGEKERLAAIVNAIGQIPEPYRETLLRSLGGDSPEEIARRHRISRGTVKSRLSRARQKVLLLLHGNQGGTLYG